MDASLSGGLALRCTAAALAIAIGLFALSRLLPASPASVRLSASVHRTGDVSVLFANAPGDATSPACGCVHHAPPGGWRGIVLPARQLAMGRRGGAARSATRYDISSTAPQALGSLPTTYGLRQAVAIVAVPRSKLAVDPARLPSREVLWWSRDSPIVTDWLSVVVSGDLHVASMSSEPVAALSPPAGRLTTIHYGSGGGMRVTTSFNSRAVAQSGDIVNGIPMVDVLGPKILIWGPIAGVKVPVSYEEWADPLPDRAGVEINADVSGWETAPAPRPPAGWVPEVVVLTQPPLFAARLAMMPATLDWHPGPQPRLDASAGQAFVDVPDVERSAAALLPRFRFADRHPLFRLHNLPTIPSVSDATTRPVGDSPGHALYEKTEWLEEEYPPTPPRTGINVFGPVRELRFSAATADLTVGNEPSSYRALTPLELDNIHGAGVLGHHMLVPIRIYGGGASINVVGSADARVNGVPLATRRPWIATALTRDSVGWFLGVASALLTISSALLWRRKRTT